jgi:hypothetical protein
MTKPIITVAMYLLFLPASYPMGVFHRHHDDPASAPQPSNSQTSKFGQTGLPSGAGSLTGTFVYTLVPSVPEPETYLLVLVGIGALAWVVRNKNK